MVPIKGKSHLEKGRVGLPEENGLKEGRDLQRSNCTVKPNVPIEATIWEALRNLQPILETGVH